MWETLSPTFIPLGKFSKRKQRILATASAHSSTWWCHERSRWEIQSITTTTTEGLQLSAPSTCRSSLPRHVGGLFKKEKQFHNLIYVKGVTPS